MSNRLINWFRFASPHTFYPLAGHVHLSRDGRIGCHGALPQRPAVQHDGAGTGPDRCPDGLSVTLDWRVLGETHVGNLVGLGRAADF